MRSPLRVETVSVLDQNEDSYLTLCGGWFRAFAMGSPFWVEFAFWAYALDWNEGLTCTSILRILRDVVTLWVECGPRYTLNRNEGFIG